MRIAFIFIEKYPNFDLDGQLLAAMSNEERYLLDTYVRTGLWGAMDTGARTIADLKLAVLNMLHQGNRRKIRDLETMMNRMINEHVYIVQFDSMHPDLADKLHRRMLSSVDEYMGYSEVMPEGLHIAFFSALPYRYKLRKGKIIALYSGVDEDEFVANDIMGWFKEKQPSLEHYLRKMDISWRFSLLDENDSSPPNEYRIHNTILSLRYEWDAVIEPTIYMLLDTVPDAVRELTSAVETLRKQPLTEADCASVSVNLRRVFEKLGTYLDAAHPNAKYRDQLKNYIANHFKSAKEYKEYAEAEVDEVANRIDYMIRLTNKGVHEDWMTQAIAIVALRAMLTIRELLMPAKVVSPTVHYSTGLFEPDED